MANSPDQNEIVAGTVGNDFLLIARHNAIRLARIHYAIESSESWGEFRKKLPDKEWREVKKELQDMGHISLREFREETEFTASADALEAYESLPFSERLPFDFDTFDAADLPGFTDGEWPEWPAQEALNWVPTYIQDRFGRKESTRLSGDYLDLDPGRALEIITAMEESGYRCTRDSLLVRLASGRGNRRLFALYASRLRVQSKSAEAQVFSDGDARDSASIIGESLSDWDPVNITYDELEICPRCFSLRGVWAYQNDETGKHYYQACECHEAPRITDDKSRGIELGFRVRIQSCCCCALHSTPTSDARPMVCECCSDCLGALPDDLLDNVPAFRKGFRGNGSFEDKFNQYKRLVVADNCTRYGIDTTSVVPFSQYLYIMFQNRNDLIKHSIERFCTFFGVTISWDDLFDPLA